MIRRIVREAFTGVKNDSVVSDQKYFYCQMFAIHRVVVCGEVGNGRNHALDMVGRHKDTLRRH